MSSQDYTPTGIMPYTQGFLKLLLQNRGDVLSEAGTFQCNAAIASVSNTTPMLVTTSAPHYLVTGEWAIITGSADVGANNVWTITVVDATSFTLDTSVADGGGGAGGVVMSATRGTLGKLIDGVDFLRRTLGIPAGSGFPGVQTCSNSWTFDNASVVEFDGSTTVSGGDGVALTGTQPAATADPGADNIAISTNQSKAWGNVSIGGGVTTINDGMNFASATISGLSVIVAFVRPMANAYYSVEFGVEIADTEVVSSGYLPQPFCNTTGGAKTQGGFKIALWNGSAIINPASASGLKISFDVKARQ